MTALFQKLSILKISAVLATTVLAGVTAHAAEYKPADLGADPNNAFSRGGHASTQSGVTTLKAPANGTVQFWNKQIALNNGSVSVDTRFSSDANMLESRVGVIFNWTGPQNYWSLQINPAGKFLVAKCVNDKYEFLHPSTVTPALKKGTMTWNTLTVQTSSATVKALINGTEVYSGPCSSVANARVGVLSQDPGTGDFKNFSVKY